MLQMTQIGFIFQSFNLIPDLASRAEGNIHLTDGRVSAKDSARLQADIPQAVRLNGGAPLAAQI